VSTRNLNAIAQLADETKFYWSVLHTAVRLDRGWNLSLQARHTEAEQDALTLGRQIARGARRIATLADLRLLSAEQIERASERMTDSLRTTSCDDPLLDLIRQRVADVAETGRLLFRGVDIGSCRCTDARSARRRLVRRLGLDEDGERLLDAADELARLTCIEAERLLAECLTACRACGHRTDANLHRIH
jgi:hypothetical protein